MQKDIIEAVYDRAVAEGEAMDTYECNMGVRQAFFELLRAEGKPGRLEVGAGTGVHGLFFKKAGPSYDPISR